MNCVFVVVFSICLIRSQTENIYLNPGDEYKYSIFTGDTLTLQCPVNSSLKDDVRWAYMEGAKESILSIGEELNEQYEADFSVDFTNHFKNVTFLRIYNITSKEPNIYKCYYRFADRTKKPFRYVYSIRLANVTNSMTSYSNGTILCELHGRNISAFKFIWEQRTLYGQHIRFIESFQEDESGTLKRNANLNMHQYWISWLQLSTYRNSKYNREGDYICIAQVFIHGRSQAINKTASIKIENKPGLLFCIQERRTQHSTIGTNITLTINFYSKSKYSDVFLRKNDSELKLGVDIVNMKNISIEIYNVTVMVMGYEIIINITDFSEEDIGNYTVNISNEFGYCNCTVKLLSQGNNRTEKDVIEDTKRAAITKSLLWYILACGSIIVVLFAMSALRSTFLKTVDTCSKPNIRKPSCQKSTEKQATKKQAAKKPRRAYCDQFMEVTLNQLNNGERILIIGQTNEMDASTETNI